MSAARSRNLILSAVAVGVWLSVLGAWGIR